MLEDDDADAALIGEYLVSANSSYEILRAKTGAEYRARLRDEPAIVLSDFKLAGYDGLEALALAREVSVDLPFIFVSGALGEDLALETLRRGAMDYVLKDRLDRLGPAVERALLLVRERKRRQQAEAERDALFASERRARELAEAANRMKDEFLAIVSHELRTPLNAVLGWSQMLHVDVSRELLVKGLATIERNARMQARLIEDLLDISRVITGKLRIQPEAVDVTAFISAAVDSVSAAATAKQITLDQHVPDGLTTFGDSDRLQQVVWNLVSNAVKFTDAGGKVDVTVTSESDGLAITVTDSGRGIQPDFLPHVFERFRQGDATTTRTHGGLGLGLAIVRHLVELHGGTVSAHSAGLGSGSRFEVRLPPARPTPVSGHDSGRLAAAKDPAATSRIDGIHVLLVEDDTDTRELVAMLLQQSGARVSAASTARAALELISGKPDVIVSDIGMPDLDGYGFMRHVRARTPEMGGLIPAIALTAYTRELDRHTARLAGFQRHVAKPVHIETLVTAIQELL